MTNYYYISEQIKKHGILDFQRRIINMLTSGCMNYETMEEWAYNFNWLFEKTPEIVTNYFTKLEEMENVQLSEDNE